MEVTVNDRDTTSSSLRGEDALPERERETLARALRALPAGADALSIVDYLYLAQLPPLLFTIGRLACSPYPIRRGTERETTTPSSRQPDCARP